MDKGLEQKFLEGIEDGGGFRYIQNLSTMTELSKETVKRIEEDANSYAGKYNIASIASMAHVGYMAGATAEATRSMIVEAEKEKEIERLKEVLAVKESLELLLQIKELTVERDAYKEALLVLRNRYEKSEWIVAEIDQALNQFNNTENKSHE